MGITSGEVRHQSRCLDKRFFQDQQTAFCHPALPPSSGHKAESRIAAPNCFRIDICVMPFTRPAEISNGVSLSDKVGRSEFAFVSKHGTIDSLLSAIVDELSPNKHGISVSGSQHDVFAGADKLTSLSSVSIVIAAVVPLVEIKTTQIAVLRDVPIRQSQRPSSGVRNPGAPAPARNGRCPPSRSRGG
jgi:hypothetical protein